MKFSSVFVLLFALGLAGCAQPPQGEMQEVEKAFASLERADAENRAPEEWREAKEAFEAVTREVEAQNMKFALLRSYSKAKELIVVSHRASDLAKEAAANPSSRRPSSGRASWVFDRDGVEMNCQCRCTPAK